MILLSFHILDMKAVSINLAQDCWILHIFAGNVLKCLTLGEVLDMTSVALMNSLSGNNVSDPGLGEIHRLHYFFDRTTASS
jgi:hypothetical protein